VRCNACHMWQCIAAAALKQQAHNSMHREKLCSLCCLHMLQLWAAHPRNLLSLLLQGLDPCIMSYQCWCFFTSTITLLTGHNTESLLFQPLFFFSQTDCVCRGFFELAPLLDYLTIALQDSVVNFGLNYTESGQQDFGNLYTGFLQNIADGEPADEVTAAPTSNVSSGVFASLTNQPLIGGAFLPVSKSNFGG